MFYSLTLSRKKETEEIEQFFLSLIPDYKSCPCVRSAGVWGRGGVSSSHSETRCLNEVSGQPHASTLYPQG